MIKITLSDEFMSSLTDDQRKKVDDWKTQCEKQIKEETEKMMHDLVVYGTAAMKDGKRINPDDIYKHNFFCEGCTVVASHEVIKDGDYVMYECSECGYREDKVLTDLLMGDKNNQLISAVKGE